jgi:hypothetical protein
MGTLRRSARFVGPLMAALVLAMGRTHAQVPLLPLDEVLDTVVRDGFVYYNALKHDRARLDAVVTGLASASVSGQPREQQVAFWLNAYNALVMRTVIDAYPIAQRSPEYPAHSVRQIPGAFDRASHKVAGRIVTLDQIEQAVLGSFGDPRVYFALGRGAIGGGRLRSEAYAADQLDRQLNDVAAECVSRPQCLEIDVQSDRLKVSPIFSWRERDFVSRYTAGAPGTFSARSPLERAVIAFVSPRLLEQERELVARNAFKMEFHRFDWTLNDLAARPGR